MDVASRIMRLTPHGAFASFSMMNVGENQVAVVTGATSGVGKAIALALAGQGVSLALVGRNLDGLKKVAAESSAPPAKIRCYQADLTNDGEVSGFVGELLADFGAIHLLVHSAGVFAMGNLETAPLADFDLQYRCNVRAPYALTQLLLPRLIEKQGQIVFINSTAGLSAGSGVSQYAATKHALKAVADSLRQEVNPRGVRVLSVYLGRTATPMQEAICKQEGRSYDPACFIQPADVAASVIHSLRLPPTAEIIDLTIRPTKPLRR